MDNLLPNDFDLIIVGTGMVESIVSAAASRIGKKVLHIDRNDYYGGQWASFNLDTIQKLQQQNNCYSRDEDTDLIHENEEVTEIGNNLFNLKDFTWKWHIPEKRVTDDAKITEDEKTIVEGTHESLEAQNIIDIKKEIPIENEWTQESILKESRKFNIDLTPKLQYARGDFVELLISSNIARYSEYRSVSRVLTWLNGQLEVVPCSRSDVFANSKVSVIEKRMLMKLLTSLDDGSVNLKNYENKTFRTFLKDKKLTPNLVHYVLYAISMSTDETPAYEGIDNTRRFLNSLGRFGKTPFLFSMYGSGEITQAFCRLSAVFGGVYALSQPLNSFIFANNQFKALLVGKQRINADHIVMGIEKSPEKFAHNFTRKYISRAILITDRSVMDTEKEHLTLLLYPPENNKNAITIIELGSLTGTCPKNLYIVHLISSQITSAEEDFKHVIDNLFDVSFEQEKVRCPGKPQVLWSCYFSLPNTSSLDLRENVPENVYLCPGPDMDLDYDLSIKKAKDIFSEIYPDTEFLPRAPDPEEIVIEGEEQDSEENKNEESDKTLTDELIQNIENENIEEISSTQNA